MEPISVMKKQKIKRIRIMALLTVVLILLFFAGLFTGSSNMSFSEGLKALFGEGSATHIRIIRNIRLPRALAAVIAGAGLSVSGLIMQTGLNNPMASPATLGVSNAAVFGANLSIIVFAGGFLSTGHNVSNFMVGVNPFSTSLMAFIFAAGSVLLILGLCRLKSFRPGTVVLAGIAVGSVWTAGTSVLQYYATDVGLSAAVVWTFGDLGRATYKTDLIMAVPVLAGIIMFLIMSWKYNALLSGDVPAASMGVNVERLRFFSLLASSLITAVCVSFLGMIGFVGIICPHATKRLLGQDHRITIPAASLCGGILLLSADIISRLVGKGSAIPVGAVTAMLGAPFFLFIIFGGRRNRE